LAAGSALLGGLGFGAAGAQELVGDLSIGGTVFQDTDRDGLLDAGEDGLAGVLVELRDLEGNLVAVTTTGFNGVYVFTDLEPGTYTVIEGANPSDFPDDTTPNTVVVDALEPLDGVDFGNAVTGDGPGTPGGVQAQVFGDLDRDGVLGFSEADRISGVEVRILDLEGAVLAVLVTDSFGIASWTAPSDTTDVVLDVQLPSGLEATTPLSTPIRVEPGQVQTISVGAVDPSLPPPDDASAPGTALLATGPDGAGGSPTDPSAPTTQPGGPDAGTPGTTTPSPSSSVSAPSAPATPSPGAVALPLAPFGGAAPLSGSAGTAAAAAAQIFGERASAGSSVEDTTLRRVLALSGRNSTETASYGLALAATGAAFWGAGSRLRRTRRPDPVTGDGSPANS
jgi:hypothetical protein